MDKPLTAQGDTMMTARAYQLEMYEESMKRNIIVAMDTGSGKTLIAVERIRTELLRSSVKKIWFLSPGVTLTYQQADALRRGLSGAYIIKALTGNEKVDTWKDQKTWTDALLGVNVVVCTYQVLLDALMHGFVKLTEISMLVFDEAHHCSKKHAANKIMQGFYHVQKREDSSKALPAVLGLSASPVTRKGAKGLQEIEQNLDAISKTPRIHRDELLRFANRPVMTVDLYPPAPESKSEVLTRLEMCFRNMKISQDPHVMYLTKISSPLLEATITKKDTYSHKHITGLLIAASMVEKELGPWATQYYVSTCLATFRSSHQQQSWLEGEDMEKKYMLSVLEPMQYGLPPASAITCGQGMSPKLANLIAILLQEMAVPTTSGIVFVETRAQVQILAAVLETIPKTKELIRSVTFVGASNNHQHRGQLKEIVDAKNNDSAVEQLRSGQKNLIISTSVCEEGIDISACNLVICFQAPPNLRSFIQRRGRARAYASKYIIMLEDSEDSIASKRLLDFRRLEKEMEAEYMNDKRELQKLEKLESEEEGYRELVVEKTGAKITLQSSVQHLHHFCDKLPTVSHTTLTPIYTYEETLVNGDTWFSCYLTLPNSVDATLRTWQSRDMWQSEKMARSDACFEAYVGLRDAGLVNNNLLPAPQVDEEAEKAYAEIEKRPSMKHVEDQMNPWYSVALRWTSPDRQLWTSALRICSPDGQELRMDLVSPCALPFLPELTLYVDASTTLQVMFSSSVSNKYDSRDLPLLKETTHLLLSCIYGTRMNASKTDFPVLFAPSNVDNLQAWKENASGFRSAIELLALSSQQREGAAIVRLQHGGRYILQGVEMRVPESLGLEEQVTEPQPAPHLKCKPLPKRADFLTPVQGQAPTSAVYEYLLPNHCTVDRLPLPFATFARMIPSILEHVERYIRAEELRNTILARINITNHTLLLQTTTAPSVNAGYDYQRLEFLGDAILKMVTAVTLTAQHPKWHEGYLAHRKDQIVSNGRLAVAAEKSGLVKYIVTKQFTTHKWRPMYNNDILASSKTSKTRELSTKTLADVIEAIIGAAYINGGLTKVINTLQIFLPEVPWQPLSECSNSLQTLASDPTRLLSINPASVHITRLESLLSYTFTNKSTLLESMTHPSLTTSQIPSYQRLEFLGDALLDYIVTKRIFHHKGKPSVPRMHRLRTATVNADILGYHALSYSTLVPTTAFHSTATSSLVHTTQKLNLLSFLLASPSTPSLLLALEATKMRYKLLKPHLNKSLTSNEPYPWRVLAAFSPEKTVSDVVEAVLGAVWIDCGGDFDVVETVARRLGLLDWLDRALSEGVKCWHPKEEIGTFAGGAGSEGGRVKYVYWRTKEPTISDEIPASTSTSEHSETPLPFAGNDSSSKSPGEGTPEEKVRDGGGVDVDAEPQQLGKGTHHCLIVVNGEEICTAHGWNKHEVETAGAEEGVRILGPRRQVLRGKEREETVAGAAEVVDDGVESAAEGEMVLDEAAAASPKVSTHRRMIPWMWT